jgi:5-(carboxyamino)imidazole ribonucleotide mutase
MPEVLILLGSASDGGIAEKAAKVFDELGVSYEIHVASAHRSPERVVRMVRDSGAKVFIGIAGVSAALPGVIAAHTTKPVIGVPASGAVNLDSILSIVQMPPGVPVAAVGLDRGDNAALLACEILALADPALEKRVAAHKKKLEEKVEKDSAALNEELKKKLGK